MNIHAKYFGDISYTEEEIVHIPAGLIGFEGYTSYLPVPFYENKDSLLSLQSLEEESLSFIIMNPFEIFSDYQPHLSEQELKELGAESENDISYYVVSVIREPASESTVNLKAPLAVNAVNRQAKQIILDNPEYSFRHALGSSAEKEA